MEKSPYLPVLEITRGKIVESIHFGAIAVVDSHASLVAWYGDVQVVTYLRSSAKPFQAMPFLESGGQAYYQLNQREIALICASHSGTDDHVRVVQGIQNKTGVTENDLLCGVHPLSHKPTIQAMQKSGEKLTSNRHNCSGKHTGMLAYTRLKGLPVGPSADPPYTSADHPIQKDILRSFAEMCDLTDDQVFIGIDGCSVPTFAVPLYNAALAYARLCDPVTLVEHRAVVCKTIASAMTSNPDMVGGPDSFDTHLMSNTQGRILCKGGAEGYQAMGIFAGALGKDSPGLGIVFKISDGDLGIHSGSTGDHGHARPAVALEILHQLGIIKTGEMEALSLYGPIFPIHNWRKLIVGQARPSFSLNINK